MKEYAVERARPENSKKLQKLFVELMIDVWKMKCDGGEGIHKRSVTNFGNKISPSALLHWGSVHLLCWRWVAELVVDAPVGFGVANPRTLSPREEVQGLAFLNDIVQLCLQGVGAHCILCVRCPTGIALSGDVEDASLSLILFFSVLNVIAVIVSSLFIEGTIHEVLLTRLVEMSAKRINSGVLLGRVRVTGFEEQGRNDEEDGDERTHDEAHGNEGLEALRGKGTKKHSIFPQFRQNKISPTPLPARGSLRCVTIIERRAFQLRRAEE